MKRLWDSDEGIAVRAALWWSVDFPDRRDQNYWLGLSLDVVRFVSAPLCATAVYGSLKAIRVCNLLGGRSNAYDKFVSQYRR